MRNLNGKRSFISLSRGGGRVLSDVEFQMNFSEGVMEKLASFSEQSIFALSRGLFLFYSTKT